MFGKKDKPEIKQKAPEPKKAIKPKCPYHEKFQRHCVDCEK